ncbi:MAG TPA: MerR family transcriptional regulator [Solirubrobacteraceae bacterium]|nr:MerR family transcriptional regulator [Solirubrobacteraceae bacterium]
MSSVPQSAESDSPNQLTIEQLAAESGMSVRNIRAHQARGLLAPPEVRARVGYYGPEHLEQLRLIRDLQDDGFNLSGIKRLLDDTRGTAERLQRFGEALSAVASAERGETLTLEELGRRFRVSAQEAPEVLAEAARLGVLVPIGGDRFQAPSPSLLAIAEEVVGRGISLRSALSVLEDVDRHCESVSRSLVELFVLEIWKPFAQADMPAKRWPEIEHAVERLGPVASEALMTIFQRRLRVQLEDAFNEITRRVAERTSEDGDP